MTYSRFFNLTTEDEAAHILYEAARKNDGKMIIQGRVHGDMIDITDALRALAAGSANGTHEVLGGVSNTGVIQTFQRIGREMTRKYNLDWGWVPLGKLNAFGLSRSIWIPGYKDADTLTFNQRALFDARWEKLAREIYKDSAHCRPEDFDFHLGQLRGLFLLYQLASLFRQNEWKTSVRYQRGWAKRFNIHPAVAEAEIISLFDKSGVFDLA